MGSSASLFASLIPQFSVQMLSRVSHARACSSFPTHTAKWEPEGLNCAALTRDLKRMWWRTERRRAFTKSARPSWNEGGESKKRGFRAFPPAQARGESL